MGGSYGGYATLVGLTFTPDVFACGVDIVGPSNLVTLLQNHRRPTGRRFERVQRRASATCAPRKAGRWLHAALAAHPRRQDQAAAADRPGANDPRCKQQEADQIVNAMQERGIPVTYVLYPDEGHGFTRPENRMSFNAVTEAFLAKHLGGRSSRSATTSPDRACRSARASRRSPDCRIRSALLDILPCRPTCRPVEPSYERAVKMASQGWVERSESAG